MNKDDGFYGYASVFNTKDCHGDVIAPGAFAKSLGVWRDKKRPLMLLWAHDFAAPIGHIDVIEEDGMGLFVKGQLNAGVQKAREALALIKGGSLSGLSIGFDIQHSHYDPFQKARVIGEATLFEISVVSFPANEGAIIMAMDTCRG